MPIHTYHCPGCERSVERLVRKPEADDQRCERGGHLLTRALSVPARRNPDHGIQR